ncbi:MAG: hypothetical protein K6C34_02985 [Alphaproteobacteria bacterium]|nr:hypothetical protein [Alphaproteobacteria bacterium]
MRILDVSFNPLGNIGVSLITKALAYEADGETQQLISGNTALSMIHFSHCKITDDRIDTIVAPLITNTSLKELDVSGNKITASGALMLLNTIQPRRHPINIIFVDNRIDAAKNEEIKQQAKKAMVNLLLTRREVPYYHSPALIPAFTDLKGRPRSLSPVVSFAKGTAGATPENRLRRSRSVTLPPSERPIGVKAAFVAEDAASGAVSSVSERQGENKIGDSEAK